MPSYSQPEFPDMGSAAGGKIMGSSPISGTLAFCFHRLTLLIEPHIGNFRGLGLLSSFLAQAACRVLSCSSWTCVDFVLLLSAGASCIRSPMMLSLQFFFSSLFVWGAPDERVDPGLEVSRPLVFFRRALQREAGKPRARAGSARYCYYSASHFPLLKLPVS